MFKWIKRRIERKRTMEQNTREDSLKLTLTQLREVMLAIDDYLTTDKNLSRQQRRQFWSDFRKYDQVRNDVFDELLNGGGLEKRIEEITCQTKK